MPDVRKITLYCLAIFADSGTPRVFAYSNTKDCIDAFVLYKDSKLYPYTFSKDIFVTEGHPLFDLGEVLEFSKLVNVK